jgi:hypothetical protein
MSLTTNHALASYSVCGRHFSVVALRTVGRLPGAGVVRCGVLVARKIGIEEPAILVPSAIVPSAIVRDDDSASVGVRIHLADGNRTS